MADILLAPQTLSGESTQVGVTGAMLPYAFHASPFLEGTEKAHIEFLGGEGTWNALWVEGFKVQLSITNRIVGVFLPGRYRAVKGMTANSVGLYGTSENAD